MLVLLVGGVLTGLVVSGGWEALHPRTARELGERAATWGPLAFIGLYSIASFAFVPRGILALAAGMAWGLPSAGYTYVGALVGESLAFGAARWFGRGFVVHMMGERWRRWDDAMTRAGFRTVLALRLVPLVPCDVINYGAGLAAVRYRDFIFATALGIVPGCILYAMAGGGLVDGDPVVLVFGIGGLAVLALAPFVIRRARKSTVAAEPPPAEGGA